MSSLLDHIRTLVEAEQGLTEAIEKSLPLLSNNTHQSCSSVILSSTQQINQAQLYPTPRNSDEVSTILSVARAYSLRTSAPPMWNPNLPVVGFATPNPLPHQLRGGALGALQLKLAREELKSKQELLNRRRREIEEKEQSRIQFKEEEDNKEKKQDDDNMDVDNDNDTPKVGKRKREEETKAVSAKQEMMERQKKKDTAAAKNKQQQTSGRSTRQTEEEYQKKKEAANMNLSDSSSSSSGSSSDEEEGSDDE